MIVSWGFCTIFNKPDQNYFYKFFIIRKKEKETRTHKNGMIMQFLYLKVINILNGN